MNGDSLDGQVRIQGEADDYYSEADDLSYAEALQSTQSKKVTEKDAELLATRIRLLKIEESKAQRNVSLARAKANHLRTIRQEVALWEAERRKYDMEVQREKQLHQERVAYMRTVDKSSRENSRQQLHKSKMRTVMEVKDYIRKVAIEKFEQEKEERERVKRRTEEIRRSRFASHQRMEQEKDERLRSIRELRYQKLREEERQQIESEAALARLKKEEMELLERVKTAKIIEDQIFQELKLAMPRMKPPQQLSSNSPRSHRSLLASSSPPPPTVSFMTKHDLGGASLR